MDFKDWKAQNQDPLKHWLSKLSKEQLILLDELKNRFNSDIDGFSQMIRDELQIRIDQHISFNAQKYLLNERHGKIINQEGYNPHYRGIIDEETNMINNDLYPEFIMSFGVIGLSSQWVIEENEVRAKDYLRNIASLNVIEFLKRQIEDVEIFGNPRFPNLEIPEWQMVLAKLASRFNYKSPTVKFTIIYHFMNDKEFFPKRFTQIKYMEFVRNNFLGGKGFTKLDFTCGDYVAKVKPHEVKLDGFL